MVMEIAILGLLAKPVVVATAAITWKSVMTQIAVIGTMFSLYTAVQLNRDDSVPKIRND